MGTIFLGRCRLLGAKWSRRSLPLRGWGTWIRTKIDGVRVRCSTVELSPNGRSRRGSSPRATGGVNSEAGAPAQALLSASDLLHRHHAGRRFERAGDRGADRVAAGQADFDLAVVGPRITTSDTSPSPRALKRRSIESSGVSSRTNTLRPFCTLAAASVSRSTLTIRARTSSPSTAAWSVTSTSAPFSRRSRNWLRPSWNRIAS